MEKKLILWAYKSNEEAYIGSNRERNTRKKSILLLSQCKVVRNRE
ncbi:hypothetical protein TSAR_004488 [Trichomalopsis sarcophagae]|uniref:Uncharacterized protein n=1 Tax=Trichomalopsis sarcophagae TaxID=543379 RepID=A0A232FGX0_9HYME|nr:hypothetical protein TSAR_004488 [Trichomalopsis sarcophagae]